MFNTFVAMLAFQCFVQQPPPPANSIVHQNLIKLNHVWSIQAFYTHFKRKQYNWQIVAKWFDTCQNATWFQIHIRRPVISSNCSTTVLLVHLSVKSNLWDIGSELEITFSTHFWHRPTLIFLFYFCTFDNLHLHLMNFREHGEIHNGQHLPFFVDVYI